MGNTGSLTSGTTCRGLTEAGPVLRWMCVGKDPVRCSGSRPRVTGLLTGGGAQTGAYPEALCGLNVFNAGESWAQGTSHLKDCPATITIHPCRRHRHL